MNKFKTLPTITREAIREWAISNIETLDVALVVDTRQYSQDRLVSVLPLCIQESEDGVSPEKAIIDYCPVILQGNSDGFLNFPLRVGDKVLIGYPKDSIEEFVFNSSPDQYYQVDSMKFQGSQAVVLGYIAQAGGVDTSLSPDNFEIKYFNTRVTITDGDDVSIETPNGTFVVHSDGYIAATNGNITLALQADGSGSLSNSAGDVNLEVGGNVVSNGATIDTSGNVITASGTDLDNLKANFDALVTSYNAHGDGLTKHNPPVPPYVPV